MARSLAFQVKVGRMDAWNRISYPDQDNGMLRCAISKKLVRVSKASIGDVVSFVIRGCRVVWASKRLDKMVSMERVHLVWIAKRKQRKVRLPLLADR